MWIDSVSVPLLARLLALVVRAALSLCRVEAASRTLPRRLAIVSSSVYCERMAKEMREVTFVILTALVAEPRHGYAIISDALELSAGAVQLQPGTLYAALDRLRAEGLVGVEREEVVQGRLRRYFALTEIGLGVLHKEAARRQAVTKRSLDRLRAPGPVMPS